MDTNHRFSRLTEARSVRHLCMAFLIASLPLLAGPAAFGDGFTQNSKYLSLEGRGGGVLADTGCYLLPDFGGAGGGDDLLTTIGPGGTGVETVIGIGTGTMSIEAIAMDPDGGTLYGADDNYLCVVDKVTGVATARPNPYGLADGAEGSINLIDVDGLAFDPTDGTLYGAARRGGDEDLLIKIDPVGGAHVPDAWGTDIDYLVVPGLGGEIWDLDDLAINSNGQMYGIMNDSGATDHLVLIDKTNAAVTNLGQLTDATAPVNDMEGLTFDCDDILIGTTGNATDIAGYINSMFVFNGGTAPTNVVTFLIQFNQGGDYESVECCADLPTPVPTMTGTPELQPTETPEPSRTPYPDEWCYLVPDWGGGPPGNDLLTSIGVGGSGPEVAIGTGTGTETIEAIALDPATGALYGAAFGGLWLIDQITGVASPLPSSYGSGFGALGYMNFYDVDGLAFDPTTGILHAAVRRGGGNTDLLIHLNPITGAAIPNSYGLGIDYVEVPAIGQGLTDLDDIAINGQGQMYGVLNNGGDTDHLIMINKYNGNYADLGQINDGVVAVDDMEGLTFDCRGILIGTTGGASTLIVHENVLWEFLGGVTPTNVVVALTPLTLGRDYESVVCCMDERTPGPTEIPTEPPPPTFTPTFTPTPYIPIEEVCYLVPDWGGLPPGDDLLTRIDVAGTFTESPIGTGTGTFTIEAIAYHMYEGALFGSANMFLHYINMVTGVASPAPMPYGIGDGFLGPIEFYDVDGLSFNPADGFLWGAVRIGPADDLLIKIDHTTGAHVPDAFGVGIDYLVVQSLPGNINDLDDIAFSPQGTLYGVLNDSGYTDHLVQLTPGVGFVTVTDLGQINDGSQPINDIEGLTFDCFGNLIGTTGNATLFPPYENAMFLFMGGSTPIPLAMFVAPLVQGGDYESVECCFGGEMDDTALKGPAFSRNMDAFGQ